MASRPVYTNETHPPIWWSSSPGHHLLLFIGGVAPTADWSDGCGQEVEAVVLEVLVDQWQDNLG